MIYLDTSAAAKVLSDETGSEGVRRLFDDGTAFVSSRLLAAELHSVADRRAVDTEAVTELLSRIALVSLDDDTLQHAIDLHSGLRTLDALHLAAALRLSSVISGILTFDDELAAAAEHHGLSLVTA